MVGWDWTGWCAGMSEPVRRVIGRLADLHDPGSLGLTLKTVQGELDIFVVRHGGRVEGYINSCPHTGVNLEWQANQFLDPGGHFIQCATHGALFRVEDGYCLRGPCAGEYLSRFLVEVEEGELVCYTAPVA